MTCVCCVCVCVCVRERERERERVTKHTNYVPNPPHPPYCSKQDRSYLRPHLLPYLCVFVCLIIEFRVIFMKKERTHYVPNTTNPYATSPRTAIRRISFVLHMATPRTRTQPLATTEYASSHHSNKGSVEDVPKVRFCTLTRFENPVFKRSLTYLKFQLCIQRDLLERYPAFSLGCLVKLNCILGSATRIT